LDITNSSIRIHLAQEFRIKLFNFATESIPRETCGVLAIKNNSVKKIFPINNISTNNSTFEMSPEQFVNTLYQIDDSGLTFGGIYHSHPNGPPNLSQTDIHEATIFSIPHIVIFQSANKWHIKGFMISENRIISKVKIMQIKW